MTNPAGGVKLEPRSISLDQQALANAIKAFFTDNDKSASGSIAAAIQTYIAALPATGATEPVAWQVTQYDPNGRLNPASVSLVRGALPRHYRTERWGSAGHAMWEVIPLFASPSKPSEAITDEALIELAGAAYDKVLTGELSDLNPFAAVVREIRAALSGGGE